MFSRLLLSVGFCHRLFLLGCCQGLGLGIAIGFCATFFFLRLILCLSVLMPSLLPHIILLLLPPLLLHACRAALPMPVPLNRSVRNTFTCCRLLIRRVCRRPGLQACTSCLELIPKTLPLPQQCVLHARTVPGSVI